jgi:hypothetical protein
MNTLNIDKKTEGELPQISKSFSKSSSIWSGVYVWETSSSNWVLQIERREDGFVVKWRVLPLK